MFKINEKMLNLRDFMHFKHQKTINEHLFDNKDIILMVKVYG